MITETLRDRLRKILALAQSGEDGERTAARLMLDRLLLAHGLTMADIQDEAKEKTWFKIGRSPEMKELINQIYCKVTNRNRIEYYVYGNEIAYMVTKVQAAEIRELFSVYAPALRKELKKSRQVALDAFIHTNGIYSDVGADSDPKELSDDELERIIVVAAYARNMEKTPVHRQIEG